MKILSIIVSFLLIANMAFSQSNAGLIAHWPFNGNSLDSTGKGHNGTINNITYVPGKNSSSGMAASFDGSSSYVTVGHQPDLNLSNYSICALIRLNGFYTDDCQANMILQRGTTHMSGNYALYFMDTVVSCSTPGDTNAYTMVADAGPYNASVPMSEWNYPYKLHTGNWYSVVATFNGSRLNIFMNGHLVDSSFSTSPAPIGLSSDSISIGATYMGTTGIYPHWFKGLIDDLRIYNRVLSDSEIVVYSTLDINDINDNDWVVSIYPNPSNGEVTIHGNVNDSKPLTMEIYNITGQLTARGQVRPQNGIVDHKINIGGSNGVYFVRLLGTNESKVLRVVVQQ